MNIEISGSYLKKNGKIMVVRVDADLIRMYDGATMDDLNMFLKKIGEDPVEWVDACWGVRDANRFYHEYCRLKGKRDLDDLVDFINSIWEKEDKFRIIDIYYSPSRYEIWSKYKLGCCHTGDVDAIIEEFKYLNRRKSLNIKITKKDTINSEYIIYINYKGKKYPFELSPYEPHYALFYYIG